MGQLWSFVLGRNNEILVAQEARDRDEPETSAPLLKARRSKQVAARDPRTTRRLRWLALAACVAVVAGALNYWPKKQAPTRILATEIASGTILIRDGREMPATPGMEIMDGDGLRTPVSAKSRIPFAAGAVKLSSVDGVFRTDLSTDSEAEFCLNGAERRLRLRKGVMSASVKPRPDGKRLAVDTPTARLRVTGTEFSVAHVN